VPSLLVDGEVPCASVHGAKKLGAKSFLDLVIFGIRAFHTTIETFKPGLTQRSSVMMLESRSNCQY
jgi:succinate dehydrogenase/fumarate reductase flavoprotein subunit